MTSPATGLTTISARSNSERKDIDRERRRVEVEVEAVIVMVVVTAVPDGAGEDQRPPLKDEGFTIQRGSCIDRKLYISCI